MSNSKKIDEELEKEAEWWRSDGESGSIPSPKVSDKYTGVYSSSRYVPTIPNPDYISQKDLGSPDSLGREAKEAAVFNEKRSIRRQADRLRQGAAAVQAGNQEVPRQGAAAVQAGNQDRRREGLRRINQSRQQRIRRDNAARALYDARGVQTTIERDILKVDNGPEIFQPFPMFNECDDIHFHIYPIYGAGIRFRFNDGSELKYDIPSNERRDPSFGLKYRGDIPNYKNIRVRQGRYGDEQRPEDEIYRTIAHQNYNGTSVWKAIRECAELPNPYNPIRGNGFSSFMEVIEGLTGIVSQRVHAGGKKGSRKTRKYKKRRVRKSRKKIKSRKSRKKRRVRKSRKSRRRSSSRRRR